MGSVGAPEILVVLLVALLVLGPERLPEAARQVGRVVAEMRRMTAGFKAEIRDAMETPVAGPAMPPRESTEAAPTHAWDDLPSADRPDAPSAS
jgi:Tat protein translocase TatB subunit